MNVFFLAAGLGTRLRPITNKYPKPCVPFLNVPMGLYPFRFLEHTKITTCVANSFHLPEKVAQLYTNQPYYKNKILISNENDLLGLENKNSSQTHGRILGSAGGLKKASHLFTADETILMMNADEIFFTSNDVFLQRAYEQHNSNNNLATLIVTKHPEAGKKFGAIWCDSNKRVKNILIAKTQPDAADAKLKLEPWHYIGVIFLNKKILSLIPEGIETNIFYDVLINLLDSSPVEIYELSCNWYETGNPIDYWAATKNVLSSLDKKTLDFINQYDPSRLVKNSGGLSLISNSISVDEKKLYGFNVIAKSTNKKNLAAVDKIENSVLFEDEILTSTTLV